MVQMNENQKKEYVKQLVFKLKDYNKTQQKYINYKPLEWDYFIKENKEDIKNHLQGLALKVKSDIVYSTQWEGFYKGRNYNEKKNIKMLKTFINSITFGCNKKFIENLNVCSNDNMLKNFTILFYLNYYVKINKAMIEVLKEVV